MTPNNSIIDSRIQKLELEKYIGKRFAAIAELKAQIKTLLDEQVAKAELSARLVELELLEQKINREYDSGGRSTTISVLDKYKIQRLADLETRLATLKSTSTGGGK